MLSNIVRKQYPLEVWNVPFRALCKKPPYKLARIVYALLQHGTAYVAQGLAAYETAYRERVVRQVKRKAAELGLVVVERDAAVQPS